MFIDFEFLGEDMYGCTLMKDVKQMWVQKKANWEKNGKTTEYWVVCYSVRINSFEEEEDYTYPGKYKTREEAEEVYSQLIGLWAKCLDFLP